MDRADAARKALRKGSLLTPEAADKISEEGEMPDIPDKLLVDVDDLEPEEEVESEETEEPEEDVPDSKESPVEEPRTDEDTSSSEDASPDSESAEAEPEQDTDISVPWSYEEEEGTVPVDTFLEAYNNRHDFFRSLLENKADKTLLVSISNATQWGSKVSVIGMVREVGEGHAIVEDTTGKIKIYTDESLMEDEGVLVTGILKKEGLETQTITYPDIPMDRDVTTSDTATNCLFTRTVPDEVDADVVIITDSDAEREDVIELMDTAKVVWPGGNSEKVITPSLPCSLKIEGLVVLIHDLDANRLRELTNADELRAAASRLLRSRHLQPDRITVDDPLLLETVPDIVCLNTGEAFQTNYKGVTVVSPTRETAYGIDLKERTVTEI